MEESHRDNDASGAYYIEDISHGPESAKATKEGPSLKMPKQYSPDTKIEP